mgnify:CR=1 FL=1
MIFAVFLYIEKTPNYLSNSNSSMKTLPDEIALPLLAERIMEEGSCKEQIKKFEQVIPKLSLSQLQELTKTIQSEEFEKLEIVEQITQDEGQCVLIQHYKIPESEERQKEANKFYTKCRFVSLQKHGFEKLTEGGIEFNILSYKTMKEKWYNAIRKKRHGDFEAFGYFTDVTTIGESAFEWDSLESIEIPKSVITIGAKAFADNNLTSVNIPDSVEYIGSEAFAGQGSMNYMVNGLTSVRIPDSVEYIGEGAFEENVITSLILPKSLKFIAPDAFRRNQLESIKIPATVKFIGEGAFEDNKLTSVNIPDSVQLIESEAFSANKLTSVSVAKSTKIGNKAFDENVKIIRRSSKKRSASSSGGAGSSSKKRRMELMQMQLKTSLKF